MEEQLLVGRQAIFDRRLRVYGYELLYRDAGGAPSSGLDGSSASARVILNAFIEMGIARITGNHPAFINLTRDFLVEMPPLPFEKERMVLEILEDIEVDAEVERCVAALARQGYRLALDDYKFEEKWEPLLPHVEIVKVEVPAVEMEAHHRAIAALRDRGIRLLGEKVETAGEHEALLELGFELFQGYHFSRPQLVTERRLTENRLVTLRLLGRLSDENVTMEELVELITLDAGLSFKVLRYINSAALALNGRIRSIPEAVIYLGLNRLRSWALLITLSGIEHRPLELMNNALVRAHMCRALVSTADVGLAETGFSAGLLSVLDLLMGAPMGQLLAEMPLSPVLQQAILDHEGLCGEALACAIACETCQWEEISFHRLEPAQIREFYLQSSERAFLDQSLLASR